MRALLIITALALASGCAHQQRLDSVHAEEGGGGFVPSSGRLVTKSLLAQAEMPEGPSIGDSAYSLTLSSTVNPLVVPLEGEICLNGTTCTKYITTSAGGSVLIGTAGSAVAPVTQGSAIGITTARFGSFIGNGTFQTSIASGNNAFAIETNGARMDYGAGASDHASSDGTTVTFAGPLTTSGAFNTTQVATDAYVSRNTANTMTFTSTTVDGTTSTTVPAILLKSGVNVTDGDLIVSIQDSASTNVVSVTEQGQVLTGSSGWFESLMFRTQVGALPTCNASREGQIRWTSATGTGTARRTAICACTYDGAGAAGTDYDWRNLASATVGDETTCPD